MAPSARRRAARAVPVLERPDVSPLRNDPEPDPRARTAGAAARAAGVLLAFRPTGERPADRAVHHRAVRRPVRHGGAVVHGPHRDVRQPPRARSLPGRDLAVADRHGGDRAGRAAGHHPGALPGDQPGDRRPVHQPDPLAEPLARGAPELGVLPERFCRPHLQPGDADRAGPARVAGRLGDGGLVHRRLRHHRGVHDRRGGLVADHADPRLVRRLHLAARLFRAAPARALEAHLRGALGDDGPHRRQLHQHPDREAV